MTGAFADGALLFPLLAALVWQAGMDGAALLATAGAAYVVAGVVFRVPMSVQPLKSIAVAALAMGASVAEIRFSGLMIGLACLALSFCNADRLAAFVPRHLVQGLQLGLGVILMIKGLQSGAGYLANPALSILVFTILSGLIIAAAFRSALPVMGWVATGGLLVAFVSALGGGFELPVSHEAGETLLRPDAVAALILPQLALTLANSVVATHDAAHRYFGKAAWRVKPSRLLRSIGIGNVLSAAVGGLPFCHGSGGLTAHVKGGAKSWHMNLIIGGVLLFLAAFSYAYVPLIPAYPEMLMAVLLFAIGFFHLQLAAPSWSQPSLRPGLVLMAGVALLTQNMLWILAAGVIYEAFRWILSLMLERVAE